MHIPQCPKCGSQKVIKSGVVNNRQRFHCKKCSYYFTVNKIGKKIDDYYVIKALQLYLEGVSLREIERLLGVSHVSVMNWVRKYNIKAPERYDYRPTYKILNHQELQDFISNPANMGGSGMLITELGDKFMLIKWERFKD
ncbi:IS1 family transposase [Fulvivirga sp. 29W222]|uniref:IS1 family transposase n=1 Tax=Fulvivirga marina TaxID=2494733 RepID=A0A937FX45_9BACT|nr:helix-turn-helix domain-containing protein [Fulvivirga marina]MBL6446638.1 IS1 family transposase [Fulvivirga marina]